MHDDEHQGQGGSYLVGKDGKRKLVERTKEPQPEQQQPQQPTEKERSK